MPEMTSEPVYDRPSALQRIWLYALAVPKTVWFNFRYFRPGTALRFPVIIGHTVKLLRMKGNIKIEGPVSTRMLLIGMPGIRLFDCDRIRTVWQCEGTLVIRGRAMIGIGSKISIGEGANLVLGENFTINGRSNIFCSKRITFGSGCLLSWEVQIIDQDYHPLYSADGRHLNPSAAIRFGDHVWIGSRALVLKGVDLPDGTVVAASAVVTKSVIGSHQVIGGSPARVIRSGVTWEVYELHRT
jgi:acetyltransferase-like isoleucine patch superfamily enzyme